MTISSLCLHEILVFFHEIVNGGIISCCTFGRQATDGRRINWSAMASNILFAFFPMKLLVVVKGLKAFASAEIISLGVFQVFAHHLADQFFKDYLGNPA
jgi:hypothetical protein